MQRRLPILSMLMLTSFVSVLLAACGTTSAPSAGTGGDTILFGAAVSLTGKTA